MSEYKENKTNKVAAKLFLCLIGLMLLLAGGVFEWLMLRSYLHAKASRAWPQVEAVVLRSAIDERQIMGSPTEFRLNVLYGYSYNDADLTSNKLSPRGTKWTKEVGGVEKLIRIYTPGSTHTAWVNPERPETAILKHDSKAAGYSLWFPALIILGGAGMMVGALRSS